MGSFPARPSTGPRAHDGLGNKERHHPDPLYSSVVGLRPERSRAVSIVGEARNEWFNRSSWCHAISGRVSLRSERHEEPAHAAPAGHVARVVALFHLRDGGCAGAHHHHPNVAGGALPMATLLRGGAIVATDE